MPGPDITVDDLMVQLRRKGLRATTARRAVLAELIGAGDEHLTADELARRIQVRHPAIHLSTVYRTLEALTDGGIISVARVGHQPVTYHLTSDVHHHAVCTRCGSTLNLPPEVVDLLSRRLERDFGFRADPHHLTIHGLCAACSERRGPP